MNKLTRQEVYAIVDGERTYQDIRWANDSAAGGTHFHTPQEWLTYITDYAEEAIHMGCREDDQVAIPKQMAIMRKIAAMGVAAMEQNGASPR